MTLYSRMLGAALVWVGVASCWGTAAAVDADVARRAEWRSIQRQSALQPHYQEAARQLGLGELNGDTFSELAPEMVGRLRRKAHSLQRAASQQQINRLQADRKMAREQNIPIALAAAQRLQEEGRQKLAKAGELQEADPQKKILKAQGEQLLAQGDSQHVTATKIWETQKELQSWEEFVRFLKQHPPMRVWDADVPESRSRDDEIIGPLIKVPGGVLVNGRFYPLQ
jgi:hypothetical protein